jgi:hypothetical protein
MTMPLLTCAGGTVVLPGPGAVLVDRNDGGNLIVNPPRDIWERSELTPAELTQWSFLVAATGRAMLDALPQLAGGCINYWEAGNWALNDDAEPRGRKTAPQHRHVHLHLLGRSRNATSVSLQWGEAPKFPDFAERKTWAAGHERLSPAECDAVVSAANRILTTRYGVEASSIVVAASCAVCGYARFAGHACE